MTRITPYQMDAYVSQTVDLYRALELEIFQQIAKQLKASEGQKIAEWRVEKLSQLNMLNNKTISELSKVSGIAEKEIRKAINDSSYKSVKQIDKELSEVYDPKPLPTDLDNVIRSYVDQTFLDLDNFVNQTLLTTNYGTGTITKMYNNIINEVTAKLVAGTVTLDKAIERTILDWADKGIASGFVDKGGHTWSLERYVDTVLRSTLNRTYNEMRTSRMFEYGVYTVTMSTVYDAAPRCAHCQGKDLDMRRESEADSGLPSIYLFGYGKPGGTLGINCRHSVFPKIPGVNKNNQPQINPDEAIARSKVRDKQRSIERRIRKTKKNIIILDSLESSTAERYKKLLRNQQAEMRELVSRNDWLCRDYKREKVYTPKETLLRK